MASFLQDRKVKLTTLVQVDMFFNVRVLYLFLMKDIGR